MRTGLRLEVTVAGAATVAAVPAAPSEVPAAESSGAAATVDTADSGDEAVNPAPDERALFVPAADGCWLPTGFSRGPWDPEALHGGPVAALIARAVEQVEAPLPMHPARVTVELLRPVPLAPLEVEAVVTRPGKKVQGVSVSVTVRGEGPPTGTVVARATAQRIRRDPDQHTTIGLPEGVVDPARHEPPPFLDEPMPPDFWTREGFESYNAFHIDAVEHRIVAGGFQVPGPTIDWIRLLVPVVPEEEPTPLQRVAAVADFGNGISGLVDYEKFTFVNPDLTIALSRLPEGEWVCLDAITRLADDGVALAESALSDRHGRIGRALQTLIIDRRP